MSAWRSTTFVTSKPGLWRALFDALPAEVVEAFGGEVEEMTAAIEAAGPITVHMSSDSGSAAVGGRSAANGENGGAVRALPTCSTHASKEVLTVADIAARYYVSGRTIREHAQAEKLLGWRANPNGTGPWLFGADEVADWALECGYVVR